MEYPLAGDPADVVRLQTWQRTHRHDEFRLGGQYTYRVDPGLGVSEITATPDGRLLVLERGFTSGVGNTVRLYLAALDDAAAGKRLLADLARCPSLGATAKQPSPTRSSTTSRAWPSPAAPTAASTSPSSATTTRTPPRPPASCTCGCACDRHGTVSTAG